MSFRLQARHIFLTYPRCDLSKEALLSFFEQKFLPEYPFDYVIAQEKHEDGGLHLHAVVSFKKKRDIRRPDYFDVSGQHPNMQACRDFKKSREYCRKDGDYIERLDTPELSSWSAIVSESDSKEAFLKRCCEERTRDYVLSLERLEYFANKHYRPDVAKYQGRPLDSFNVPVALDDWVSGNLQVSS